MRFDFDSYSAEVTHDTVSIYLDDRRYVALQVSSLLNGVEATDMGEVLPEPDYMRYEDGVNMNWRTSSGMWEEKTYHIHLEEGLIWYQMKVKGKNAVQDLHFFEGSSPDYSQVVSGHCEESNRISRSSKRPELPPPCYALGFETGPWLAAGIAAEKNRRDFSLFEYSPAVSTFCFRLEYNGKLEVDGIWTSPFFIFRPGKDEHTAIASYCDLVKAWGMLDGG